jgi:hypothetical protein
MVGSLGGYGERWAGWLYWSIGVSSSPRKLEDMRVLFGVIRSKVVVDKSNL